MGSESRRYRASESVDSELVYLCLLLFLCLGFLSGPADYGNTLQYANPGAFVLEQWPREILAAANLRLVSFSKQCAGEVIAIANSASNNFGFIGEYSSAADFLVVTELKLTTFVLAVECNERRSSWDHLERDKLDRSLGRYMSASIEPSSSGLCGDSNKKLLCKTSASVPLSKVSFDGYLDTSDGTPFCSSEYHERPEWTLSPLYLGSGDVLSEVYPQRRPWFMVSGMEQIEVVIDNKIPMGMCTESMLNHPSSAICLDSIQKIFSEFDKFGTSKEQLVGYILTATLVGLRFLYTHLYKTIFHLLYSQGEMFEIKGSNKKLYYRYNDECSSDIVVPYYDLGLSPNESLKERAKVVSIILAGFILFVIILIMAWNRLRNVILFKSNNELGASISEESNLNESYLTDQILYENLFKEAVLVSEGSSGKVFKVRFLDLECAMKVFHSNARMNFRKESITLTHLSHPHIVQLFCSFRKSFIIMELMDEDLYSFITKIRERRIDYEMPLEVALDVMLQIAEGMSYLHNHGIAHQDLKSLNILLKLRGDFHDPGFQITAKVADFESARSFDPSYPKGFVLFPNTNIGTRLWRAPELFHPRGGFMTRVGMNPKIMPKPLDIYGFAVICSELVTKQIPFSNDQDLRVAVFAAKIREGHRPALPSDSGCPEGLLSLIKDCWHRDPVLRPEFHEVCTRLIEVKSAWMSPV